jgi:RNA polymerase sigma-70 factor (ECF subfamily)
VSEEDYGRLIQANRGRLTAIARSYADRDSYEDLVQEIYYQLWRSRESFEGRSEIDTWVYRIALNTAISFLRGAVRRPKLVTNVEPYDLEPVSAGTEPQDQTDLLSTFMSGLNKVDRAILILYLEDKSYGEIGTVLGLKAGSVGVRLNRMKTRLQQPETEE